MLLYLQFVESKSLLEDGNEVKSRRQKPIDSAPVSGSLISDSQADSDFELSSVSSNQSSPSKSDNGYSDPELQMRGSMTSRSPLCKPLSSVQRVVSNRDETRKKARMRRFGKSGQKLDVSSDNEKAVITFQSASSTKSAVLPLPDEPRSRSNSSGSNASNSGKPSRKRTKKNHYSYLK